MKRQKGILPQWVLPALGIFLFLTVLWPSSSAAQEEVITVRKEAYADGVGRSARDAAIAAAESEAVEEILRSMVASGDLKPLAAILRNAAKYVRNYDLLRQDAVDGRTRTEIDAHILERPLEQDVAALMLPRLPNPPRVLLIAGEKIGDDKIIAVPDFGIAETSLSTGMKKLGVEVSGSDAVAAIYSQSQLIEVVQSDVEVAGQFAKSTLFDVVILGTAVTAPEETAEGGTLIRNKAAVTLRIFRGRDGKMVDSITAAAAVHGDDLMATGEQAVTDACAKLVGDATVASVITLLGMRTDDQVLLLLANPGDKAAVKALVESLQSFEGVAGVEQLLYTMHMARLRIAYAGTMPPLVAFLREKGCGGGGMDIKSVIAREITAACM